MSKADIVDVIDAVVKTLDAAGIEYAITGSMASGYHGEPVSTQDVDIVVRMTPQQARQVARDLPQRFFRDEETLIETARKGGLVNLIDMDTTFKVDLSVVAATPYHREVFQRRQGMEFEPEGPSYAVVSPEDIILMKLVWRKDSRSQKQWENALSVVRVKGASLDWKYLFEQSRKLDVEGDLVKLRDEGGV
ncbi:MAG: hypothetical protein ACYTFA_05050 [Planctomycetota bacterium]|jgi:hypothetical protein